MVMNFFHSFIQQINIEGLLLCVCYWARKAEVMQEKKAQKHKHERFSTWPPSTCFWLGI